MVSGLSKQITEGLRALPSRDINLAISIAILTAILNVLWVGWNQHNEVATYQRALASGAEIQRSLFFPMILIRISVALVISAASLWFRNAIGLCVSALSLLWVGIEYIGWYNWSWHIKEGAGIKEFPSITPHIANLYGATGWNMVVLLIAVALFVWEVKTFASIVASPYRFSRFTR
jgi:hypothetical protein